MILLIDNYDSFTYNLVQMMEYLSQEVGVFRNDRVDVGGIETLAPSALVISPGPGSPDRAGISMEAVRSLGPRMPVLGVCLGHQAIAETYGGRVVRAHRIMHGKRSAVFHDGRSLFRELPNPFQAVRYHSLIVDPDSVPSCLEVSAWTREGEVMGLRHREFQVEGVQFHPESILTEGGEHILKNFVSLCSGRPVIGGVAGAGDGERKSFQGGQ